MAHLHATRTLATKSEIAVKSRLHEWHPTTKYEVKSIENISNILDCSVKEILYKNSMVPDCISRNRFEFYSILQRQRDSQ